MYEEVYYGYTLKPYYIPQIKRKSQARCFTKVLLEEKRVFTTEESTTMEKALGEAREWVDTTRIETGVAE